jgi:hypothetical protein
MPIFAQIKMYKMNGRRLYDQVMTIFGTIMVFFYLGLAYIFLFTSLFSYIDIALRAMLAIPLLIYGFYRAFTSYRKIKEVFFDEE